MLKAAQNKTRAPGSEPPPAAQRAPWCQKWPPAPQRAPTSSLLPSRPDKNLKHSFLPCIFVESPWQQGDPSPGVKEFQGRRGTASPGSTWAVEKGLAQSALEQQQR